jgi:hypothetical protein
MSGRVIITGQRLITNKIQMALYSALAKFVMNRERIIDVAITHRIVGDET